MKMLATMLRVLAALTAVLGLVKGVTVTMPVSAVNTTVGANVTLPCMYSPASAPDVIQWNFRGSGLQISGPSTCLYRGEKSASHCEKTVSITDTRGRCSGIQKVYIWQSGKVHYLGKFVGRIQVANNTGNATLSIFNMQPSDTGLYTCSVYKFEDATGSESEKSVSVSVLVPPSKPLCNFGSSHHPDVEIGHLITLACISEIGLPKPTYKWYKLTGDKPQPVTESYNPYSGRLVLGNLSQFEEGHYQCTAVNSLGNSSCHIDLTTKHSESGIIVGALIAAILAAALICIVGWIVISREKKKRRKEKPVAKEMQPMAAKAEYAAVPSQATVPMAAVPPNKDPNETGEHDSPEEAQVTILPENETQEMDHQPVS